MKNRAHCSLRWQTCLLVFLSWLVTGGLYGQVTELEIWQIQGSGNVSPHAGSVVRTSSNIVTAVNAASFYMQTPPARSDQNPNTSDGIMVYTGFRPSLQVGDLVTVTGKVQEYFTQTEFGADNISITVVGSGQPVPDPVVVNGQFPGTDPGAVPDLERVEGMLVQINGISTGPTGNNGRFPMRGGGERAFREPGIRYPGLDGYPVWDGNPEVFWFDPDGLGAPDNRLVAGGTLVTATALINGNSWGYLALPLEYTLEGGVGLRPVRDKRADEITVASLNSLRLIFGSGGYGDRVKKTARYIQELMRFPDIIGFQEVGSKRVLDDLAVQLELLDNSMAYDAYLIAADGDIQTGFLVKKNLFSSATVTALGRDETYGSGARLHDRPPLLLEVQLNGGQILRVINLHLRSLNGIEGDDGDRVREKRYEQAVSVANMVQQLRDENLVLLGDFNAFEFTDGYVDVVNQIQGTNSLGALFPLENIVQPPLRNLTLTHQPPAEHYSYVFDGSAQMLDHCLANELPGFVARELAFARGNADQPEAYFDDYQVVNRASDHDGFVLFLSTDTSVPVGSVVRPVFNLTMPNPIQAGQVIRIDWEEDEAYTLYLLDAMGRICSETHVKGRYLTMTWPEGLMPGLYFLQLSSGGGAGFWKVIGY